MFRVWQQQLNINIKSFITDDALRPTLRQQPTSSRQACLQQLDAAMHRSAGVDIQTVNDNPDGPTQQLEQQQKLQHNQQEQQEQQPQQPKAQQQEQATQSQLQLEQRALQAQKQQQQHVQLQSQHQEQQPQQQQELRRHMSSRSSHVAAAAAKRSQLLSKLAAARVAARAKIVRLPLRLTIAGRAGSRRYLTVPVDVEGKRHDSCMQCPELA